jgi:hypothetical protein
MIPIRGIVVCVDYDCELEITLPRNMRHFTECLVITSPADKKTSRVVAEVPDARCYVTDAFYRSGAKLNKGLALEEGFTALGRWGTILVWDADIVLPDAIPLPKLDRDTLYGAPRRILHDPKRWSSSLDWRQIPVDKDPTVPGYFQLFNAEAKCLQSRPWYGIDFTHAGGGDAVFMMKFKQRAKLPFEVLHLGPNNKNWFGRVSDRLDGEPVSESAVRDRNAAMKRLERSRGATGRLPWEQTKDFPT